MKKILLSGLMAGFVCCAANASDDGFENYTIWQSASNAAPVKQYVPKQHTCNKCKKTCSKCKMNPVRIKDYTEVIDHYRVYQPVVVYQPAGTYSERRIIETPRKCNKCGF